jgi:large subunit ribosomal protein L24
MEKKIELIKKHKIKKNDLVLVISGKSKQKQGKVLQVVKDTNRVIIEGLNMVARHTKPSASNPNGGIIRKEAAIHISNVMLIDPKSGKPTRVGRKLNGEGKLVRFAKISGEEIK